VEIMSRAVARASVHVDAPVEDVWEALTEPELMHEYLFGATVSTDWSVGSPITFEGEWDGRKYEDKGEVLAFLPEDELAYTHWSPLSGTEDAPENYQVVDIAVDEIDDGTEVTLTQMTMTGEVTEDDLARRAQYEENWTTVLEGLKETVLARAA
jgi:uncharacterized protein YndB with AHSA1/START domain